jgi:hypothetical protein
VLARGAVEGVGEAELLARAVRCDQRREDRRDDEDHDEGEADERGGVAAEAPPGVGPEPAAGPDLELDVSGFELGDAHERRILGLITA